MKTLFLCLLIFTSSIYLFPQNTVEGTLIDISNLPIESVSCTLQKVGQVNPTKIESTNSSGKFRFINISSGTYLLTFQRMAYDKESIELQIASNMLLDPFVLISTSNELSEVVVKGERPIVKATAGKLIYNVPLLIQKRIVSNAFAALKTIPNILSSGEDILQLVGASEFTILLNGQPTNMNMQQMQSMLKSMPADRIANVEIMYSTPPQYNVRGASINIILTDKKEITGWQGEIRTNYTQAHYSKFGESMSLLFTRPRYSIDFGLSSNQNKSKSESYFDAIHSLSNGEVYSISETNLGKNRYTDHNIRLHINYNLNNEDKLQLTYTGEFTDYNSKSHPHTQYEKKNQTYRNIYTDNDNDGNDYMHNIKLNFASHKKLNVNIDHTNYRDPSTRIYKQTDNLEAKYSYKTWTQQKIGKTSFAIDHTLDAGKQWIINYGGNISYSTNDNDYDFFQSVEALTKDSTSITKQKEVSTNIFGGFTKSIGGKFSLQLSLSANYFRATTKIGNQKRNTLWNEFTPFLNTNLTYNASHDIMCQLSFASNIKYPPYWFMSGDVAQMNSYSFMQGNPNIKFSKSYEGQFMLMLKRKYIFLLSYEHITDRFYQMPYQSPDELRNTFTIANLDYAKTISSTFITPFNVNKILNSRIVFSLLHQMQKDSDFYDIPFNRNKTTFTLSMTNSFNISSKPNIKLEITAFYMHGALQGIYDVKRISNISSGVKWAFLNDKAELSINVNDIFRGCGYKTVINYLTQNSQMKIKSDTPSVRISFAYRFNSYKKPKTENVDTSRFGRE